MSAEPRRRQTTRSSVSVDRNGTLDMSPYVREQLRQKKQGRDQVRVNAIRANAALPEDTWSVEEDTVYPTFHDTTRLVSDLRAAGLTIQRDIMAKFDYWHLIDDEGEASEDMDPETATSESSVSHGMEVVPVPVYHDDFSLGFREGPDPGEAVGDSLDTLGADVTSRHVGEKIEQRFIGTGDPYKVNDRNRGTTLYGLTDHPDANTDVTDADWTTDASVIRSDVRRMRSIIKNDNEFAPGGAGYWLYLGTDYYDILDDYDRDQSDTTVRERIQALANISAVRELDMLPDKSALMFRPTRDVIDVGIANDIQVIQYGDDPFRDSWKTLASIYPRVKSTLSGQSGIAYFEAP